MNIFLLTMINGIKGANIEFHLIDKAIHCFVFSILSLLMVIGLKKQNTFKKLKYEAEKNTLIICICYGWIIEMIQYLLPYRSFSWIDVFANACGALIGLGMFYMIYKFRA